jgi:hypothetical protein
VTEMSSQYSGLSERYSALAEAAELATPHVVAISICIGTQRAHSRMCDKGQEVNLQRVIKRARNKTSSDALSV